MSQAASSNWYKITEAQRRAWSLLRAAADLEPAPVMNAENLQKGLFRPG